MAIANTAHGTTVSSSTANTTSGALTVAVQAGECIVVAVCTVGTQINAPTDNATGGSNTYVILGSFGTNTERVSLWGVVSSKSAVTQITCTFASSRYAVAITTYTGVVAFEQLNTTTNIGSASPATITLPSPLNSGSWAVAGFANKGTATWSASTGNLRANIAGAGTTTPGAAIVDNTTTTCAAAESASNVWAATAIEMLSAGINVTASPTGQTGTASTGSTSETGAANVAATGSSTTSAVGSVTVSNGTNVSVAATGQSATSSTGSTSEVGDANVAVTGSAASSAVGAPTVSVTASISVAATGTSASSAAGSVAVGAGVTVSATGNAASSAVGTATVSASAAVSATGQAITSAANLSDFSFADNFNRPNGTLYSSSNWLDTVSPIAPLSIVSQQVTINGVAGFKSSDAALYVNTLGGDQYVQLTIPSVAPLTALAYVSLFIKQTQRTWLSSLRLGYEARIQGGGGQFAIYSLSAVPTLISFSQSWADGDIVEFWNRGNTLYLSRNGVVIASAVDATGGGAGTLRAPTYAGFGISADVAGPYPVLDDVTVSTVAIVGDANVTSTGNTSTTAVGTVAETGSASVATTGQQVGATAGTALESGAANVNATGNTATSASGGATVTGDASAVIAGQQITSGVGSTSETGEANIAVTGNTDSSSVGTVIVTTGGGSPVLSAESGSVSVVGASTGLLADRMTSASSGAMSVGAPGASLIFTGKKPSVAAGGSSRRVRRPQPIRGSTLPEIRRSYVLPADSTRFFVSVGAADLRCGRKLQAAGSAMVVSGEAAMMSKLFDVELEMYVAAMVA